VNFEKPDLKDRGRKIENVISFFTTSYIQTVIEDTSGEKRIIRPQLLIINSDTVVPEEISTRGQSTLHFYRKSYSIDLKLKTGFVHGDRTDSLKRFYVLSLSMDKYYHNNRLAYEMMENSGLFKLFYTFCEVRINNRSDGIHMIVERPDDWAMRKKASPILIRRGYNEDIDNIKTNGSIRKNEIARYCNSYKEIYRDLNKYQGEELYKALSDKLDLDNYMKWMAFNFLIRNGDYSDEVYFYYDPDISKFSVIPWDYDDLFRIAPHEGKDVNKKLLGGKLIFSAEDLLDKKIAADPYLYGIYLQKFKELLGTLSPGTLKRIFENTFAELYPYYSDNEIISMSKYDVYQNACLPNLTEDLQNVFEYLAQYIDFYYNYLNSNL
jgi:spore coat protein H